MKKIKPWYSKKESEFWKRVRKAQEREAFRQHGLGWLVEFCSVKIKKNDNKTI